VEINDENIGKFFQEQLKDVEVQPDAAVWNAVQQKSGISSGLTTLSKVALFIAAAAVVLSSYYLLNDKKENVEPLSQIEAPIKQEIIAEVVKPTIPEQTESIQEIEKTNNQEPIVEVKKSPEVKAQTTLGGLELCNDTAIDGKTEIVKKVEPKTGIHPIIIQKEKKAVITTVNEFQSPHIDNNEAIVESEIENDTQIVLEQNSDTSGIAFSPNKTVCFGEDAVLEVYNGDSYEWVNGANTASIKVSPVEQSSYWVIVRDKYGNEKKHSFTVYIDKECTAVFVPSAFTPNGDGVNDAFKAEGLGVRDFEMVIINREGQIIFESHNIENAWDGTWRNAKMKAQVYFYQISYIDAKGNKHKKRGQVTLIK